MLNGIKKINKGQITTFKRLQFFLSKGLTLEMSAF